MKEDKKVEGKKKLSITLKAGIITFCIVVGIYIGVTMYYASRFNYGTSINCISVSGKTVDEAKEEILSEMDSYVLELNGKGNAKAEIKGKDINLNIDYDKDVENIKDDQNPLSWIAGLFKGKDYKIQSDVTFDEGKLKSIVDSLNIAHEGGEVPSKNAGFEYKDGKYVVVDEVYGNIINKEALYKEVETAIKDGSKTINLEEAKCYVEPEFKKDSEKTLAALATLNKYVTSKINYNVLDDTEVIDGALINTWVGVNEKFEVVFDEGKIKTYVNNATAKCNTLGKTRSFQTSVGKTVQVKGGDYGWKIDTSGEVKGIVEGIKSGKTVDMEVDFAQTAFASGNSDIGKTYVEINFTKQHMWYYIDGKLITEGNIVTGDIRKGYGTPTGVYRLKYKQRDTVLRGQDYASPVTFWMPFNGGIGIHDASWRNTFGGSIYKTNGSHGCINSPYNVAKAIFDNIKNDTPIVCYYE